MNPGTFYYMDIGTYCRVFIMLLQKRIAAVQNSNIRGLSLKMNALSYLSLDPWTFQEFTV